MVWVLTVLVIVVAGVLTVVAVSRGAAMSPAFDDRREVRVPADRPLRADDVRGVRFTMTLRGYRMSEVDALLARLAAELEDRETGRTAAPGDVTGPPPGQEHRAG